MKKLQLMKKSQSMLGVLRSLAVILIFTSVAASAKADVLMNQWNNFAFPITDETGCAGEDSVASGLVHLVYSDFKKGSLSFHLSAKGVWKGNDSGLEATWKDNFSEVIPIVDFGNHFIGTFSRSLKIIGQGGLLFRLNANVHLTQVGGEFVVYFDEVSIDCNI